MASDKRQVILDTASDLMASFLYYDRKENNDLGRGEIEAAITQGVVTLDELLAIFRKELEGAINGNFDCADGAACDCDGGAVCSCHLDDTLVLSTQAAPKTEDLRPNVPPRML